MNSLTQLGGKERICGAKGSDLVVNSGKGKLTYAERLADHGDEARQGY